MWLSEQARKRGAPWPAAASVPAGPVRELGREVVWSLKSGGVIRVLRGPKGWMIDAGVMGLDRAATPNQALQVLARVIRTADYAGWLQLLPQRERAFWTSGRLATHLGDAHRRKRWLALSKRLESPPSSGWNLRWQEPGQRVAVDIGATPTPQMPKTTVIVGREQGVWKVLDVLPHHHYTARR